MQRRNGQGTGNSAMTGQQQDSDPDPQDDQVIELVGGVPFIYPDTPQSERDMQRIRGVA